MTELTTQLPKLPTKNLQDGAEIIDSDGNIWVYDAQVHGWVLQGHSEFAEIVSETNDGLITPDIYKHLRYIEGELAGGVKLDIFKIRPALSSYWYYLLSSNKTIKFEPEGQEDLRIEVNKPRLFNLLSQNKCRGSRGDQGIKGPTGKNGILGKREREYNPEIDDNTLFIDASVAVLLDTPISLRIYDSNVGIPDINIYIQIDSGDYSVKFSNLDIDQSTSFSYDRDTEKLTGNVVLDDSWPTPDLWRYKVGQIGDRGNRGIDGRNFLVVNGESYIDSNVRATQAAVSMRVGGTADTIYYFPSSVFETNCVSKLNIRNIDLVAASLSNALLAVDMVVTECKPVTKYLFEIPVKSRPDMVLPDWTPLDVCWDQNYWQVSKYEWSQFTKVTSDLQQWPVANETESGDPAYPWTINYPTMPGHRCCVSEGTLIHTDRGLVPIENLSDNCRVLCPDGEFRVIEEFFDNGIKECVKLTLSDGSAVTLTPDHKIPVGGILVEASSLSTDDQIYKTAGLLDDLNKRNHGIEEDFKRGYAIGFLLGDGWISAKSIGIMSPDYEIDAFKRAYDILSSQFGVVKIQERDSDNCILYYARWRSEKAKSYFLDQGWYKNNNEDCIKIPNSVFSESYLFYSGLFSGLTNTDGCIDINGDINVCCSVVAGLPCVLQHILNYMGIATSLRVESESANKFTENRKPIHRLDILRGSVNEYIALVDRGLSLQKLYHKQYFESAEMHSFTQPSDKGEYNAGLVLGIFTFLGGYNLDSSRAWISVKAPIEIRRELSLIADCEIKDGKQFFKGVNHPIVRLLNNIDFNVDLGFAKGFCRAAVSYRTKLAKDGSFVINRNSQTEHGHLIDCLDILGIYNRTINCAALRGVQYRTIIKRSHDIYKLFVLSGYRDKVGILDLAKPDPGHGIVTVKFIEPVGEKRVYDYKVGPHYMMAANGIILFDCQEDFFFCPNINDEPCGIVGTPDPPPPPCPCCECDNPIALELQGGYDLGRFSANPTSVDGLPWSSSDCVSDNDSECAEQDSDFDGADCVCRKKTVESVLDGTAHHYTGAIAIEFPIDCGCYLEVETTVRFTDLCDDARAEATIDLEACDDIPPFTPDCPRPVPEEDCQITWTTNHWHTGLSAIGEQSELTIGDTQVMQYIGCSGTVFLDYLVNTGGLDCCLGYAIDISYKWCCCGIIPSPSPSISLSPSSTPSISSPIISLSPSTPVLSPSISASLPLVPSSPSVPSVPSSPSVAPSSPSVPSVPSSPSVPSVAPSSPSVPSIAPSSPPIPSISPSPPVASPPIPSISPSPPVASPPIPSISPSPPVVPSSPPVLSISPSSPLSSPPVLSISSSPPIAPS